MTLPHVIRELEKRLETRYEKDPDDKEYRDTEPEGWYYCDYCGLKIYYSRAKPRELVRHETECDGASGVPEFESEQREP